MSLELKKITTGINQDSHCFDISKAQNRMYIIEAIYTSLIGPNIGNVATEAFLIEGELDTNKFKLCYEAMISRHESLRSTFFTIENKILQKINSEYIITFPEVYIPEEKKDELDEYIDTFIQPFNLEMPLLIKATLIQINSKKYIFILSMHHIIGDGYSLSIILKEILKLYNDEKLPDLDFQYKDFAYWQNKLMEAEYIIPKRDYWVNRFCQEIPLLKIKTDFKRPPLKTYQGDRIIIVEELDFFESFNLLAMESYSSMFIVLLSAYYVLLFKYSGQKDIIIGSPIACRPKKELENIVGMFVNMLPLRININENCTFLEFMESVRGICFDAYENQEYQFNDLVSELHFKRDMSRNPIFDYVFALQNFDMSDLKSKDFIINLYDYKYSISRFDASLSIMVINDKANIIFEYSTDIFTKSTAKRILMDYLKILRIIKANSNIKIIDIEGFDF